MTDGTKQPSQGSAGAEKIIVLRYGELFLKGQNRPRFEKIYRDNVARALSDIDPISLDRAQGRLFVRCPAADLDRATDRLSRVFGATSVSVAAAVSDPSIANLGATAVALLAERQGPLPASFKVETQRADKSYPATSIEVSQQVGAAVVEATSLPVDLHHPALVVGVEIGKQRSFVYVGRVPGAGGLPTGSEGKVLLLLSGGIDSPVAGHLMQKRGCALEAVYFHSPPYTSEHARDKVLQLAGRLVDNQPAVPLHVVHFTEIQCDIRDHAPPEMAVVLYRRAMMRIACALAARRHCAALATGENLGQVASQTLENMAAIEHAADRPVLRPLLSFDKAETTRLAQRLGSYEISILPHDDCCSLFVPKHPVTRSSIPRALKAEAGLDPALIDAAVDGTELVGVS